MTRKVFYSFHYDADNYRVQQIRNIGALDGNPAASANKWEEVKKGGDAAIEKWIKDNMKGRSCVIVLVGAETAGRKWINYEISHGWNEGKGVLAVRIHKLKNAAGETASFGENPLDHVTFSDSGKKLSSVAKIVNPSGTNSKEVYASIKDNIADWIEEAIKIRDSH